MPHSPATDDTIATTPSVASDPHAHEDNEHNNNGDGYADSEIVPEQAPPKQQPIDVEIPSSGEFDKNGVVVGGSNQPPRGFMNMRKSVFGLLVLLLLCSLAAFGYFFYQWWDIERNGCVVQEKSLACEFSETDIVSLETKIEGLEGTNAELSDQVDDLYDLTQSMNNTIADLTLQNQQLQDSHGDCHSSNGELSDEIAQLQAEIDRLEAANNQLGDQLQDYEDLNDRLNATVQELNIQNGILSDNNDQYEQLNQQLNASLEDFKEQNLFLAEQVETYTELNQDLNVTVGNLNIQVDRLEDEVDELSNQNDRLEDLIDTLNNETATLWELSDDLQQEVDTLETHVDDLKTENNRLEGLVLNLENIASFLDETAGNLDETYDALVAFLSEQIATNRRIVIETLQNTYHQRIANWDCALRDRFVLEDFANNGNLAIPDDQVDDVMDFVEERVLSELCLDTDDFTQYLEARYLDEDLTTNRLVTSIQRYTWLALDYYFPEDGEVGLEPNDWATANYDCHNLPDSVLYNYQE